MPWIALHMGLWAIASAPLMVGSDLTVAILNRTDAAAHVNVDWGTLVWMAFRNR